MGGFLKQSTQITIMFGPFVDKADGVTLKTDATTITDIDHATTGIFLSKNGATGAIRHQGIAAASVADAYGMMKVTLDATDTGTVGRLRAMFAKAATYLPVQDDFIVLPANVYDSLIGTDLLDVNQAQLIGTAPTEGAGGRLAAGMTKLWDVATPVLTAASVNQSADNNTKLADIQSRIPTALGADGFIKASLFGAMGTALTETAGYLAAAIVKLFNVATPLLDCSAAMRGTDGAYTGTPPTPAAIATGIFQDTTAGDFTAANSIGKSIMNGVALGTGLTVNDLTTKTGFSLVSTGLDLVLSTSTFAVAMAAAIWNAATSGLTTAGSIGKRLVDLFAGITVLAQWLGLLAGKQVGNSTARTELRATGAGSGTFDETTDSLEAFKDAVGSTADVAAEVLSEMNATPPDVNVASTDDIDFSATQKTSLNAATPAASNMRGTDSAALAATLGATLGTDGKTLLSTDAQDRSTTLKVYIPDTQKVDTNTLKGKSVTVDAGGTTFPAVVGSSTLAAGAKMDLADSLNATGVADLKSKLAKVPATLAAGDVTGNLPGDVKAWNGGALPTVGDATAANQTSALTTLTLLWKWAKNKYSVDKTATPNTLTLFDNDDTTPILAHDLTDDASEATRARGA